VNCGLTLAGKLLRYPITGIPSSCACAATGQAAA
jgi:hypothetical protein